MKFKSAFAMVVMLLLTRSIPAQQPAGFFPGEPWNDSEGHLINAHNGCVIESKGLYYWYGEKISRKDPAASNAAYEGISCYVSSDLLHWKNKGLVFAPDNCRPYDQAECPRILYQKADKKWVMWLRLTARNNCAAALGLLTSHGPAEPFTLVRIDSATVHQPGEITVFRDTDDKGYLFYTAGGSVIHAVALTSDYQHFTSNDVQILDEKGRGAPVVFKHHHKYYLLTSSSAPHSHSMTHYSVADHIMGAWKTIGGPFMGPGYESGYESRPAFALPLRKPDVTFVYLADHWNPQYPERSTYVWLPMGVDEEGDLEIPWQKKWNFIKMKNP